MSLYLENAGIHGHPGLPVPIQREIGNQENVNPQALQRDELMQMEPLLNNTNDANLSAEVAVVPVAPEICRPQLANNDIPVRNHVNIQMWTRSRPESIQPPIVSNAQAGATSDENNAMNVNPAQAQICEPEIQQQNVQYPTGDHEPARDAVLVRSQNITSIPIVIYLEAGPTCTQVQYFDNF